MIIHTLHVSTHRTLNKVWTHMMLTAVEGLGANRQSLFVILTIPLAVVSAAGHLMSFGAGSFVEAAFGEAMSAGFEVVEYFTYLRGETHFSKSVKKVQWAGHALSRGSSRVAAAGEESSSVVQPAEEERTKREDRLHNLTCLTVVMGMVCTSVGTTTI